MKQQTGAFIVHIPCSGGNPAQQFAAFIERERAKYARIVKLSGAKVG